MRITVVENTLGDLADDLAAIPRTLKTRLPRVVARNAKEGNRLAQQIAREKAGPHGKNYWKRLSAESISPLSWEYGPSAPKTEYVGVNKAAGAYMDLAISADFQGPKFAKDVGDEVDKAFG